MTPFRNRLYFACITDAELRNIIDKLANFVARNGPEFEQMTMHKQRDNPKFSFLFGGENYNYYKWKVTQEELAKAPHGISLILVFQYLQNYMQISGY